MMNSAAIIRKEWSTLFSVLSELTVLLWGVAN
jgi:hypothetical protein